MHDYEHIIGESETFKYVMYRLEQIAPTHTTVSDVDIARGPEDWAIYFTVGTSL